MTTGLDNVLRLAQEYLSDVPTIVLGSGASVPHDIPGMGSLANYLMHNVHPADPDDIIAWKGVVTYLQTGVDLESALNRISVSNELLREVISCTWKHLNDADLALYKRLISNEISLPLADLFKHFTRTSSPTVSVLTTNYDRIAEYAANIANCEPFTGFESSLLSEFIGVERYISPPVIAAQRHKKRVHVWKVHGSLGWFRRANGEVISTAPITDLPSALEPLIVGPGLRKYQTTHYDPFRTCMTQADTVASQSKSFLCVGYGFNDEHVQAKMMQRVRQGKPIVVLTRELTPAARNMLLNEPPKKFLLLEMSSNGTRAYHPSARTGEELSHPNLWTLASFIEHCLMSEPS